MTALPKTPTAGARTWIAAHARMLNDPELLMRGEAGWLFWTKVIMLSGAEGLEGRIPADARLLQVNLRMDGGIKAVQDELDAFRDMGKLVDDPEGDDRFVYIRAWAWNQADRAGSTTRAAASRVSQNVRRHDEGHHNGQPRQDCPKCSGTMPNTPEAPAPGGRPTEHDPVAVDGELNSRDVKTKVWDRCTELVALAEEDGEDALAAYDIGYETAQAAAAKYAHVKGIGDATLLNVVVSHAATTYLSRGGKTPESGTLRFLHGLRRDHGFALITQMADPLVTQAANPVAYLRGCYRNGDAK